MMAVAVAARHVLQIPSSPRPRLPCFPTLALSHLCSSSTTTSSHVISVTPASAVTLLPKNTSTTSATATASACDVVKEDDQNLLSKKKNKKSRLGKGELFCSSDDKRRTRSTLGITHDHHQQHSASHIPVMLSEILQVFQPVHLRSFLDCTLGAAGHSLEIIRSHPEMQFYLGMDVDPVAFELGKSCLTAEVNNQNTNPKLKVYTHLSNFKHIKSVVSAAALENEGFKGIDGILMDLGMSSMQINDPQRGFSILGHGPLDMRMDPQESLKAEDILNSWPEAELGKILREYGEESNWRSLQRMILNTRTNGGLHYTTELVDLIRRASHRSAGRKGWIKTATRVFQALRIAVNNEQDNLRKTLYACFDCLSPGGMLAVISFHSLEDRIVKHTFLDIINKNYCNDESEVNNKTQEKNVCIVDEETWCKGRIKGKTGIILSKRPITPSEEEEKLNQRCRSAKLRVGSGFAHNIRFSNIQVKEVQTLIVIDQYPLRRDRTTCKNHSTAVSLSGISYENIKGTFTVKPVHLACWPAGCSDSSPFTCDVFFWQTYGLLRFPDR